MKNNTILWLLLGAALISGCAKEKNASDNADNKAYIEAWLDARHPGVKPSGNGIYILDETAGDGAAYNGEDYIRVRYVIEDMDGTISSTTETRTAQQLGTYDLSSNYYGPVIFYTAGNTMSAGLEDIFSGMRKGGMRKVLVPAWLMGYKRYDSADEYFRKVDGDSYSNTVYTMYLDDFFTDVTAWELSTLKAYLAENQIGAVPLDEAGLFYKKTGTGNESITFPKDTSIYINYTGRLMNGQVFDTTVRDTAKVHGIYKSSKTYEPVKINWGEQYSDLTMGTSGSSPVEGFTKTLFQMHPFEKGTAWFVSDLGYGSSGSSSIIPGYATLVFDFEIVPEP